MYAVLNTSLLPQKLYGEAQVEFVHVNRLSEDRSRTVISSDKTKYLKEDLLTGSHGSLDVHLPNVLPLFLEQTREEVGGKLDVHDDLLLFHANVSDGNVQAHDLLHLELDRGLDLVDLLLHVLAGGEEGWELTRLGQARTEKTGDLFDHVVRREEEVVLLRELLDQLLVLVELLEVVRGHLSDLDAIGLLAVGRVTEDAALEVGTGDLREAEGAGEALVALGIVVFEGDLELD
jgi:hypothetical protein